MQNSNLADLIGATTAAADAAIAYLRQLDSASTGPARSIAELRAALGGPIPNEGAHPTTVVDALVAGTAGGHAASAGGRFFGWVIGGALPSALAADWLTSAWDQNAASAACGPAAAVAEEVCGEWVKDLLRLPPTASFALTTGCQMSHVTCLLAARHRLLVERGWNVEEDGLRGAPPIRVLTSDQRHMSLERACRMIGIGRNAIELLPSDHAGRLIPEVIAEALAQNLEQPTIVVLQAGDLNVGAFDQFTAIIPAAREAGAWVHIDGAFGLWLRAEPQRRSLLEGVEGATSWATDAHKWLNVPYDCGLAFIDDRDAHRAALATTASYLVVAQDARDQMDWSPEWSRRARAFPVYAALRELGRSGLADLLDRTCRHAHTLAVAIGRLEGAELVAEPVINQGLVRFVDESAPNCEEAHDRRTDAVIAAINAGGEALFTPTTWRSRRAMRISVCSWRTSARDIERSVAAVAKAIALCRSRGG